MVKTPQELKKSYQKRPQNLPFSKRAKPRAPRTKKLRTATAFDKNAMKKPSTMAKYRYGYSLAWKVKGARERLLAVGFKPPGTYGRNQQNGHCFSMPYDIPKAFGDEDAGWVLRECFASKEPHYTRSQLDAVRAMLSHAYQMQTGKHCEGQSKEVCNYPSVKDQWGAQDPAKYAAPTKNIKSVTSVEPEGLKTAFTTEWTLQTGMDFMLWVVGLLLTWDWCVNGMRSKVDIEKIKQSDKHVYIPSEGWMSTELEGGRSKLNSRKGKREWSGYRVCLCPGGKHKPVPQGWNHQDNLDPRHNPITINWCTNCPLNAFQIIRESLPPDDLRTYPQWLEKQNRYGVTNIGFPRTIELAKRWLDVQGANPDGLIFDQNSGRKALGKWCDEFNVLYSESHNIHGDLYVTWKTFYQYGLRREHVQTIRTQSKDPNQCCLALRKFARAIGRGREVREDPKDFNMNQLSRLMVAALRAMGKGDEVASILDDQKNYED